ncbi:MAG: hypothetical protein WC682_03500 [Parcubacteria group bacterium]|jgi:chromosome segregation ATPase
MNHGTNSTDGKNEDEIRMARASLRRDLIAKKEAYRREYSKIEKIDLENRYLVNDKSRVSDEIETKKGRLRGMENEINRLMENIESGKKTKKTIELELDRLQKQFVEVEAQIKSKNHEKEKWQDELRDMDRDIKRLEVQIREM